MSYDIVLSSGGGLGLEKRSRTHEYEHLGGVGKGRQHRNGYTLHRLAFAYLVMNA